LSNHRYRIYASHSRFSRHLTYTRAFLSSPSSASITNVIIRHFIMHVFLLQSMVISTQPGNAVLFKLYQEVPRNNRTRKNIMRENSSFSQYRHFFHDKFLSNDKSLQIHKRWCNRGERLFEIVFDHKGSWILSQILKKRGEYFFGDDNFRNLAYYIWHWAIFDHAVVYDRRLYSRVHSIWIQILIVHPRCHSWRARFASSQ